MKIKTIHTNVYAAALYGIEAAQVAPDKIGKLTAVVVDAFQSRNNSHNVDKFFTTITNDDNELDPMVQILTRRVLQLRRACSKQKGTAQEYKAMIRRYAEKQMVDQRWPTWFQPAEDKRVIRPTRYPEEQPHPTTKEHDEHLDEQIAPPGPIGLLIESVAWRGLVINGQLRIWH